MTTASLELCKELYKLSGWEGTNVSWYEQNGKYRLRQYSTITYENVPAYDLGYLLRKLPRWLDDASFLQIDWSSVGSNDLNMGYWKDDDWRILETAKQWHGIGNGVDGGHDGKYVPIEDVAAKLAIELFKQSILGDPQSGGSDE